MQSGSGYQQVLTCVVTKLLCSVVGTKAYISPLLFNLAESLHTIAATLRVQCNYCKQRPPKLSLLMAKLKYFSFFLIILSLFHRHDHEDQIYDKQVCRIGTWWTKASQRKHYQIRAESKSCSVQSRHAVVRIDSFSNIVPERSTRVYAGFVQSQIREVKASPRKPQATASSLEIFASNGCGQLRAVVMVSGIPKRPTRQ